VSSFAITLSLSLFYGCFVLTFISSKLMQMRSETIFLETVREGEGRVVSFLISLDIFPWRPLQISDLLILVEVFSTISVCQMVKAERPETV